jgi:hypothetical protein
VGGDGDPVRTLSWRFPPVPTLTVTPARCRRALLISRKQKAQRMAGLWLSSLITRKIDMMGLIYDHSATTSSGINEDLFAVENLGGMDNCRLFQ